MLTIHPIELIVSDPAIRGGKPVIAGRAVAIADLVAGHIYRGETPEELAINYALDLAQVYAALSYYYQHKEEMDEAFEREQRETEKLLADLVAQGKASPVE